MARREGGDDRLKDDYDDESVDWAAVDKLFRKTRRLRDLDSRFQQAVSNGNLLSVIATLRAGMDALAQDIGDWMALHSARRDRGPVYIPFVSAAPYALAALSEDRSVIVRLDDLVERFGDDHDPLARIRAVEVTARARSFISEHGEIERFELRRHFERGDWSSLTDFVSATTSVGVIYKTTRAGKTYLSAQRPELSATRSNSLAALGAGSRATRPHLVDLRLVTAPGVEQTVGGESLWAEAFDLSGVVIERRSLRVEDRRPASRQSISLRDTTWLVTSSRAADGLIDTEAEVLDRGGSRLVSTTIEAAGYLDATPGGDAVVGLDRNLNVRIFDQEATLVAAFSLWTNSNFREIHGPFRRDLERHSALRSVSVSLEHDLFVFSVLDCVFVYRLSEHACIGAFRLPAVFRSREVSADRAEQLSRLAVSLDLPPDASPRQLASLLDAEGRVDRTLGATIYIDALRDVSGEGDPLGAVERLLGGAPTIDWAYFAQLSHDGTAVWIGGHSGILVRVDLHGFVSDAWVLPAAPRSLSDSGVSTWAGSEDWVAFLNEGSAPDLRRGSRHYPVLTTPDVMVTRAGSEFRLIDLRRRSVAAIEMRQTLRAIYLRDRRLVIESPTNELLADVD